MLQDPSLKENSAAVISREFLNQFNRPDAYLVPHLDKIDVDCQPMRLDLIIIVDMIESSLHPNSHLKQVVLRWGVLHPFIKLGFLREAPSNEAQGS